MTAETGEVPVTLASERRAPDDRAPYWRRALLIGAAIPCAWLILRLAALRPDWVESVYSEAAYPVLRGLLRALVRLSPLHVSETLLLIVVASLVIRAARSFAAWRRGRRSLRNLGARAAARTLESAAVLYVLFLVSWGFNHSREPYARHAGLEVEPVQQVELEAMLTWLVTECNELRGQIDEGDMQLLDGEDGVDPRLRSVYDELASEIPALSDGQPLLRKAYLTPLLGRLGISGIYSPFTAEAHINAGVAPYLLAFTSAHEIAHFKGFAREDEANFIAWQVCRRSTDSAVRYSGTLVAMSFTTRALASTDGLAALLIRARLDPAVLDDLEVNRTYWESRHTVVTDAAEVSNDLYLKSQGQEQGRKSYGRMVDLIVAEWRRAGRPGLVP